jgi:hypothetical protein
MAYKYKCPPEAWKMGDHSAYFTHGVTEDMQSELRLRYPVPDGDIAFMCSLDVESTFGYEEAKEVMVGWETIEDEETLAAAEATARASDAHGVWLSPPPVQEAINDLIRIMIETEMGLDEESMYSYQSRSNERRSDRAQALADWKVEHEAVKDIVLDMYPKVESSHLWVAPCPALLEHGMCSGKCVCNECLPF